MTDDLGHLTGNIRQCYWCVDACTASIQSELSAHCCRSAGVESVGQVVRGVHGLWVVCDDARPAVVWMVWWPLYDRASLCRRLVQPTMSARHLLGTQPRIARSLFSPLACLECFWKGRGHPWTEMSLTPLISVHWTTWPLSRNFKLFSINNFYSPLSWSR